jgi:DNA-binding IclR family transcriptional regulator
MGRKKGFDKRKVTAIISVLANNPDGLWLRRIAQETKLHPSTVTKYIDTLLKPMVEDVSLGGSGKPLLRVIRLKSLVLERLQKGERLDQIMKVLKLMNQYS